MRLLLVDDDEPLAEALANELIQQRYAVDIAVDSESCKDFLALFDYDLVVLDVGLPHTDGITLCEQLRSRGHVAPILMLSATDSSDRKVAALNAGADDYVVKPFDFAELTARIHALLRRDRQTLPTVLQWGDLSLNPQTFEAAFQAQPLHLTPKEFALLEQFLRHSDRVFNIDAIIENLWSFEDPPSEYAVRTHIKGLRQKLAAAGAPKDAIETVYGVGYRLNPNVPASDKTAPSPPAPSSVGTSSPDAAMALARAWTDYREAAEARLSAVEAAIAAFQSGHCNRQLRQEAAREAHKLVGSLGSFGFIEGSAIARPLETLLEGHDRLTDEQVETLAAGARSLRQILNATPPQPATQHPHLRGRNVLAFTPDPAAANALQDALTSAGMSVEIVASVSAARAALAERRYDAAIAQVSCPLADTCGTDGTIVLRELHGLAPAVPAIVVLDGGDLATRLEIARLGGHVVSHPTAPAALIEALARVLQPPGASVLVVDDDPHFLAAIAAQLAPWQFQLETLADPTRFWQVLEDIVPDVLVLDVAMPDVSGIELCQVLRSDVRWEQLPAIFLTAREDAETRDRAFASGADDFITKPVAADELARRIQNRLERSRAVPVAESRVQR